MENYIPTFDDIDAAVGGYTPLPDIDASLRDYYETHKESLMQQMIHDYGKMVAKKVASKGLSMLTGNLSDVLVKAPAISKTTRHLASLNSLLTTENYECVCRDDEGLKCAAIIQYIIQQKSKKLGRIFVDFVPGVGTVHDVGSKVRAVYKFTQGTLGQTRGYMAYELHKKLKTCSVAQAVVAELLGSVHMQRSWVRALTVRDWDEGWKMLEEKMASS